MLGEKKSSMKTFSDSVFIFGLAISLGTVYLSTHKVMDELHLLLPMIQLWLLLLAYIFFCLGSLFRISFTSSRC
jgi:hypothetical protein